MTRDVSTAPSEATPTAHPLIRWIFDTYAKGEHTVPDLLAEATARGLTIVPTPQRPSGPVGHSTFFKLLRNPYYIGQVRYQGALHPGAHEPIVDPETWQQVQTLLDTRATAGERRRKHDHYLKGTLYCGTCTSRLQLDYARNRVGVRYAYYICTGRTTRTTTCTRKAVPVGVAEQLVADCYHQIAITPTTYAQLAERVEAAFDRRLAERSQAIDDLTATKQRLEAEADKLLQARFADAIDLPTLKRHQDRIRIALADVTRRLELSGATMKAPADTSPPHYDYWPTVRRRMLASTTTANASPTKPSTTASRSPKTKKRQSSSTSRSPLLSPHQPVTGVLIRLIWWSIGDSNP